MALITIIGMGPGVSLAVAKRFAKEGFSVAMLARKKETLDEYKAELEKMGVKAYAKQADVSDFEGLRKSLAELKKEAGETNVLVYNAAVLRQGRPSSLSPDTLVDDFKVNVAGALCAVQEISPAMEKAKKGTIIFTGGGLAIDPYPAYTSLGIGKAGIRNFALGLASELGNAGIHVATVTIRGIVKAGGAYDPSVIAESYWKLHNQKKDQWEKEVLI